MEIESSNLDVADVPTVIGFDRDGEPIWAIAGAARDDADTDDGEDGDDADDDDDEGAEDSDADDADDDADEGEDDDEDEDGDEKKGVAAKKRPKPGDRKPNEKGPNYDVTLKRERLLRKKTQRELAALRKQHETDADKARREADEAASAKYKPVAIKAAASAALVNAKVRGTPDRALRLLDLTELEIDEDTNDVIGLDDQIDVLRTEFPELFAPEGADDDEDDDEDEDGTKKPARQRQRTRKPAGSADGATKKPAKKAEPKTSAEKLVARAGL